MTERVIVAMSGGVDSSVAAALVKQAGYEPIGVTLQFRPCGGEVDVKWCCGGEGQNAARAVAALLDMPHYVFDFHDEFESAVLRPCWDEYARGRTPNPCVLCNQDLKWSLLLERAKALGATKVATGHYARILRQDGKAILARGIDPAKDQSYFLFSLSEEQLRNTLFPLGEMHKTEIRKIAAELALPNAAKPDSQDACFVGKDSGFAETLRRRFNAPMRPGVFVDESRRVLGNHEGVHQFTIGQRRFLGIALGRRAYVQSINPDTGEVVVSCDEDATLSNFVEAESVQWSAACPDETEFECELQVRYCQKPVKAVITRLENHRAQARLLTPVKAVTPGQAIVFYDAEQVLGGGWIS